MPLVLPNQGLPSLLNWMLRVPITGVPDLVFTLFVNDLDPDADTVFNDLERATFGGFQEQVLERVSWTSPILVDDFATTTYTSVAQEFTVTADPETVYGWAAYNPDTLQLVIVERFDEPRALVVGQTLKVLPRLQLGTWVPCP